MALPESKLDAANINRIFENLRYYELLNLVDAKVTDDPASQLAFEARAEGLNYALALLRSIPCVDPKQATENAIVSLGHGLPGMYREAYDQIAAEYRG